MSEWQPAILKHPKDYCPMHQKKTPEGFSRAAVNAGKSIRVRLGEGYIIGWEKGDCQIVLLNPEDTAKLWPDRADMGFPPAMHSCQLETD